MRLKVDNRIRVVLENAAAAHHRALVVLVGERSKDQVVFIHNLLNNTCLQQATVLWCYKKELTLSSNKKKRFKQIQDAIKTGQFDANEDNLFEKFVSTTTIKYTYYKDTFKVLGNTFKMCVLQDFEGITANTLCRVVETVEGGGAIVLLLQSIESLKQLYTLCMDVHARYRTHAHRYIKPRFNERLLQSLSSCSSCIIIDDHLRVVPHSQHIADITSLNHKLATAPHTNDDVKLMATKKSMKDTPPIGRLVELCKTLDQAKVLLQFSLCITEKLLRTTVSLTAARGRGKSAAMGLAIAGAVAHGYANIYVTSPSPENLKTLFEFVEKGLQATGYEEGLHYYVERSTDESLHRCVTRVKITRDDHQVIQYITPDQSSTLGQAELLVIDEAAAIPLPMVRSLMGPYLVFLSSTVAGYEGTGRSLALKLLAELRTDSQNEEKSSVANATKRKLVELTLEESIRYRNKDPVESWLTSLLCLEPRLPALPPSLPPADQCQLYYVNRDTLFSYHTMSEEFLCSVQSLLVSSHYRNSPDDLQQLSDAPAHHLFVLLPPHTDTTTLPPTLVVVQVVLEGGISRAVTITGLNCSDGDRPAGDLIPWTVSNAFQNYDFPLYSGARILRIATHPCVQGKKYGTRAIKLLQEYYSTNTHLAVCKDLSKTIVEDDTTALKVVRDGELSTMCTGKDSSEGSTPPLLSPLKERPAEPLHYLGVAYGVTQQLLTFWKRLGFTLVYISQVCNKLTGEHTVIMLQQLQTSSSSNNNNSSNLQWVPSLWWDCRSRLVSLMQSCFHNFSCQFALSALTNPVHKNTKTGNRRVVRTRLTLGDLDRLSAFMRFQCESALISELLPKLAVLYFNNHIANCKLKSLQAAVLCGLGLQYKNEAAIAAEFSLATAVVMEQKKSMIGTILAALKPMLEGEDDDSEEDESLSKETEVDELRHVAEAVKEELEHSNRVALDNREDVEEFVKQQKKRSRTADGADAAHDKKKQKKLDLDDLRRKKKML
uniref:RNA cytidine acetyltransferase n=1 Tax=Hirondellea gigas TaxID=1518452 RepID=A0A2P2I1E9_9CRUS